MNIHLITENNLQTWIRIVVREYRAPLVKFTALQCQRQWIRALLSGCYEHYNVDGHHEICYDADVCSCR